jgi:hypothetical protein
MSNAIASVEDNLTNLVTRNVLDMGDMDYDDKATHMLIRQMCIVNRKIQKHVIRKLTLQFGALTDLAASAQAAQELLRSGMIPAGVACQIAPTFFEFGYDEIIARDVHRLGYLTLCLERMEERLREKTKALWARDLPGFLKELVKEAQGREVIREQYFVPFEGEVAMSRCLFHTRSVFQGHVDQLADRIAKEGGKAFGDMPIPFAELLKNEGPSFRSAVRLSYFRCIFDRVYERHPELFAPKLDSRVQKADELSRMPARLFVMPDGFFEESLGSIPIRELFCKEKWVVAAKDCLEAAVFAVNPIDAIFQISQALSEVHNAALIARTGKTDASQAEIRRSVPFDDLFSLFFGVVMATGPPVVDIFRLEALIMNYAPKSCLCPELVFAQTYLEALVAHITDLDIEALTSGNES